MIIHAKGLPIVLFLTLSANALPSNLGKADFESKKCGYESCPKVQPEMLNVHLVPHTHDDVGWLKTVDQYYYGSKGRTQKANVQTIIDSVIQSLLQDSQRKFVYVESAFFWKWWNEQDNILKENVKMLVNEGRLEFIGGAWSMNDEATTHYHSIVDQFTWGLRFLNDTFGECARPKIGWQIDPFGHSREQASLFAKMGYDGIFFARLDYQDKQKRLNDKTLEMVWKASENLDNTDILTGVLYSHYSPPRGFCFDILCDDEPINDDKDSADYNVDDRVEEFVDYVQTQASKYRSNNVMLTMGDDFHFMAAQMWFKNMDKLIKYTNKRQNELKIRTGYYTSRPTSKRFERIGNQFLQICKALSASSKVPADDNEDNLGKLRRVMGVMQHHDAITGTEKQHVANDYHRELHASIKACEVNTRSTLNQLVTSKNSTDSSRFKFQFNSCLSLNISSCEVPESSEKFVVTIYNPLGHSTNQYARFPVGGSKYEVRDAENTLLPSQLVPIPTSLSNLHYRSSSASHELVFQATEVSAVGYKSFYVTRTENSKTEVIESIAEAVTIGSEDFKITFGSNGLLSEITVDGTTSELYQNFVVYKGAADNVRSSGAYVFRPNPEFDEEVVVNDVKIDVVKGEHVDEVHQKFNDWISQVVRIYKSEKTVEFKWLVGPIPINDVVGKEIVSRFYTTIDSDGEFFTDSNGREMIKRKRNYRETWNLDVQEPVAGNYYPINTKIAIEDAENRLAILTDRVQGGSSLLDGSVELMVHRRLLRDDGFGVGEALNETAYGEGLVARGKHWLIFGKNTKNHPTLQSRERTLQNRVLMSNWLFFDDLSSLRFSDWRTKYTNEASQIGSSLPQNVYLMTFEPWKENSFLIRFEHILEKNEDPELSKPVNFNLTQIFPGEFVFAEVSLAGNQWIGDMNRLHFKQERSDSVQSPQTVEGRKYLVNLEITLNPMEIRTFIMSPPNGENNGVASRTVSMLTFVSSLLVFLRN